MVLRQSAANDDERAGVKAHVLILEAPYYRTIASLLADGAVAELEAHGASFERIEVPGALELPQAFAIAAEARMDGLMTFDAAIVLGCVIRGETSHYDIVCNTSNDGLMKVALDYGIPLGNALLTVDTQAQAVARAEGGRKGKGGDAVRACLSLIALQRRYESASS